MRVNESALRRLDFEEPVSRLAIWSKKLAQFALLLALLAIVAAHAKGGLARFFAIVTLRSTPTPDPGLGLVIFILALAVAAASLVIASSAAVSIWIRGRRGVRPILAALLLLTLFAPYPAWLIYSAGNPPWLADISTDLDDAPAFSTSAGALRGRGGWTPPEFDASNRQAQAESYSDVKPITVDMETQEAFKATHDAVEQLHWTIIEEVLPGDDRQPDGRIEALTHSAALNLPVAITIRVRPGNDSTTVDMRAATRFLHNDLGAGAALIGKLSDALEEKDDSE